MKIQAILVIANVPSSFKNNRMTEFGYNHFGHPTMIWSLESDDKFYWTYDWAKNHFGHTHTTSHAKKNMIAYKLYKENGLPIIHINKKRAILYDRATRADSFILRIQFRKSDLCLK